MNLSALWGVAYNVTLNVVRPHCYLCQWWGEITGTDPDDETAWATAETILAAHLATAEHQRLAAYD